MPIERSIYISARRWDLKHAVATYEYLTARDYDVFIDHEVPEKYPNVFDVILPEIDNRAHFIVILTPGAGINHLSNADDNMRRAIERAIEMKRNIIPLMFNGLSFGAAAPYLTGRLAVLSQYAGVQVRSDSFDEAMTHLCNNHLNVTLDALVHPTAPDAARQQDQQIIFLNDRPIATQPIDLTTAFDRGSAQALAREAFQQGIKAHEAGQLVQTVVHFTETIVLQPNHFDAFFNRGVARQQLDDLTGAIEDFTRSIELDPPEPHEYYFTRGNARMALGDDTGAIADYDEVIRLVGQHPGAINNRGIAHETVGNLALAIADFEAALRLKPDSEAAQRNLERSREKLRKLRG